MSYCYCGNRKDEKDSLCKECEIAERQRKDETAKALALMKQVFPLARRGM